jgi:hypothetical protein
MDFWQWVFAVIGLVAFLMAVQPFTQFIWGRPRIEINFIARDVGSSRYLDIVLSNRPVESRILKRLKIRREKAESVFLSCTIKNTQTDKLYAEDLHPEIDGIQQKGLEISLPSSTTPAFISLIVANHERVSLVNKTTLIPGKYLLTVTVHYSEIKFSKQTHFFVGVNTYELCWDATKSR